jgi:DNA-binding response OmpR family regulator
MIMNSAAERQDEQVLTILLYASDQRTRTDVRLAVGRKVAADLPPIRLLEVATPAALISALDAGGIDLVILDGEAVPAGGMGLSRQLKDEILRCPPILLLIGRPDDAWLATWSRADGAVSHPIDPIRLPGAVAKLLHPRLSEETAVVRTTSVT